MTLPDIDALPTVGGALFDYSQVVDPTRDRPAAGANQAYADAVAATHTIVRAWARCTLNGSATPVLVAHDSVWGNAIGVAPTFTRTSAGIYTATWPATVNDEIPNGLPGYNSPHTVNFRGANCGVRAVATAFDGFAAPTSANIVTFRIFNVAGSAADPGSATDVDLTVW